MSRCYRYAFVCLLVGCIQPRGAHPQSSGPDWLDQPVASSSASEKTDDYNTDDHAGAVAARGQPKRRRNPVIANSDWWMCTVEGSAEPTHGSGPTREEASFKAMETCHTTIAKSTTGQKRQAGSCSIVDCIVGR